MKTKDLGWSLGPFLIPAEPEAVSKHCEICARGVLDGEYEYPRDAPEDVTSIVDVGCNVGAFTAWATKVWWPGKIEEVHAYDPNARAVEMFWHSLDAGMRMGGALVHQRVCAVTVQPRAVFRLQNNWGGSRTYGETEGFDVRVLHPCDLPPADVLKVDGEGIELEVFESYQHWNVVKVALFEWHFTEHRGPLERICREVGLVQRKTSAPGDQGVQCWVRG
jgi:hypothetical protein